MSQRVVRLAPRPSWQLQRLLDHALGILTTPEMHKDRCEHPMSGQADASVRRTARFGQRQRFCEPARGHEIGRLRSSERVAAGPTHIYVWRRLTSRRMNRNVI